MTTLSDTPLVDADDRDAIVGVLGALGTAVHCAGVRSLPLEGRNTLWLVQAGVMDLFAVDSSSHGRWHFLGRLEPGVLLPSPDSGTGHTLVGRPLEGCALRRISLGEVIRTQRDTWAEQRVAGRLSHQESALVRGVDLGLRVMIESTLDGLPPQDFAPLEPGRQVVLGTGQYGRSVAGVVWLKVLRGKIRHESEAGTSRDRGEGDVVAVSEQDWVSCGSESTLDVLATGALLLDDVLWQRMIDYQAEFLLNVDRWTARLDQAHEERTAAGLRAGEDARELANQALLAVMDTSGQISAAPEAHEDATLAACRLVAEAAGITLTAPTPEDVANGEHDLVEQIAVTSLVRTRKVDLEGRWWRENVGPLLVRRADDESGAPVALVWRRGGYDVVEPLTGRRRRVTRANVGELAAAATMFYRPLPEQPVRPKELLLFGMRGSGADLRDVLIGALVAVALGLTVPLGTGQILGVLVPNAERGLIIQVSVALLIAGVVAAAFMLLQNVAVLRVEGRFDGMLQAAVWDRLLRLPTRFFTDRSTGELASAAMGVSAIRQVMSGVSSMVMFSLIVGVVNLGLLLWYSVTLTLVAMALVVAGTAGFIALGLRKMYWQRQLTALVYKLNNRAFQTLRGLPKLRVAAAESFAYAHWAHDFARSRRLEVRIGRLWNVETALKATYLPWCTMVMFVLMAGPARGLLTVTEFLTFNVAFAMILSSVLQFTGVITSIALAVPLYDQLKPVLQAVPEVRAASSSPGELSGEIEANHLSFRYTEDGPLVLQDVSFRVLPGEFVAIVGGSGSGKSTLLRTLIGFDEPTSGTVLYDGQDLSRLDRSAVRRQCGVVLQSTQPFAGTILECIRGNSPVSLDEVWEAAAMAGVDEEIRKLPMGMYTVIGDEGGTLSGGQGQRLLIAQALIRKPRILFFDEATSALDNETQGIVTESTRKLHATRIVIAHRLSTIMDADRVLVMQDGQIVQAGPPAELRADPDGLFHRLLRWQMR